MAEKFIFVTLSLPVIGWLIYSVKYPEDAYMMGERWKYDNEPELSEEYIKYCRFSSISILVIIALIYIFYIF